MGRKGVGDGAHVWEAVEHGRVVQGRAHVAARGSKRIYIKHLIGHPIRCAKGGFVQQGGHSRSRTPYLPYPAWSSETPSLPSSTHARTHLLDAAQQHPVQLACGEREEPPYEGGD